jgi:predicted dehydrogenase
MTRRDVGFGIVGCGGAALDVAAAIGRTGTARVAAVHDLRIDLATDLASGTGATVHATLDALLEDPAVDAVYVALPHDLLAEVAGRALAAGRPALVEKPMAITLDGVERLATAAEASGLALGVLFEMRETGPARQARRLLADGAIGDVTAVRIRTLIDKPDGYWMSGPTGRTTSPWRGEAARAGGGVVLMNSIHQLDLVGAITGLTVTRVRGETATLTAEPWVEVEDTAAAVLRFSNGAIGSLVAAAHSPGVVDGETIEIDGRAGSLRIPDLYGAGELSLWLRRPHGALAAGRPIILPSEPADPYRDAVSAFVDAVVRGEPAPVGAADAARALAVVQQLYDDQVGHDRLPVAAPRRTA